MTETAIEAVAPTTHAKTLIPSPSIPVGHANTTEPNEPADPLMAAIEARWFEFEEAENARQPEIFVKTLGEPELMDDEMAYGMLSAIYDSGVKEGEPDRVDKYLDLLNQQLPGIYAQGRHYYLCWRILHALAARQSDRVMTLACEIAETAGDHIDLYSRFVRLLAYHGELAALSKASRIAWPLIRSSTNIRWGRREFARWGVDSLIFEELQRNRELDSRDPQLIENVQFYFPDFSQGWFDNYVRRLSGQAIENWSPADFGIKPKKKSKSERGRRSKIDDIHPPLAEKPQRKNGLSDLASEFIGYAHFQEGIPYTKAKLARRNIVTYLKMRNDFQLEARPHSFEASPWSRSFSSVLPQIPDHPLAPDPDTLDRYLAGLLHLLNFKRYDAAVTIELIPVWLRFLESRGLIEPSRREFTLSKIAKLRRDLINQFAQVSDDPTFAKIFEALPTSPQMPAAQAGEDDSPDL